MPPHVSVLSTGGTIASTSGEDGATPEKSGEALVAAVPELDAYADLSVTQVAQKPSFDMDRATVADVGRAAMGAVDDGADAVVVTHGTDTMEESAYWLDLALDLDAPVVYTGAQRRPDEVSADGPANVRSAVRFATDDRLRDRDGVYVAFNQELHAARDVTKTRTAALQAFESPEAGPVAVATRESIRYLGRPGSRAADVGVLETDRRVAVVTTGVDVDGAGFERAVRDGADGVVVEGTGLGNTTAAIGDAVGEAIDDGVPVVVASRCLAGAVEPVYGTGGGGETLRQHGALFAGALPAHKARIKLLLALERTSDLAELREFFG